ncbi:MAG TPA: cytochrome c oxidase subunit 4 [Anaerolineae bacterium]|nr:cytochrome c oxidase subunit 4 [Anaerolineae bacterium]
MTSIPYAQSDTEAAGVPAGELDSEVIRELERVWRVPTGLAALTAVNQRVIGKRYLVTAFIFFLMAGMMALTMITQLSRANVGLLSAEAYNQFFTMHGTSMMFLFAVPVMEAIGIYVVPLMIGTRDMAFPRLNQFGYFVYLIGGITLFASFVAGRAPDAGWFAYVPLSGPQFSPSVNIDFYATAVTFLEVAALTAAIEMVVTIFKMRAPGMSINRMPLFVWALLVISLMIIFAMPPLMLASLFLAMDRLIGTQFFNVDQGGNILLWQHLFWWFGHPEVYIIAIPAFGMISTIVPTFTRRRVAAYLPIALALVSIGIVSFGLWVHHMFAAGISVLGSSLFAAASMSIAIPSGVQVFAWIGTIWDNVRLVWRVPFFWALAGIVLFVLGGITGIMVGALPFDWQVHDSHFVTAHFHYVLIGASVFPLFGGLYYWFPKMTGRLLDERLGMWSFWLAFIGFNVAFFTLHFPGLDGMPRRIYTYSAEMGWATPMTITAVGAFTMGLGFLLSLINVPLSVWRGKEAGDNPWEASTLEWSTTSPPPPYNFAVIPTVSGRDPLWEHGVGEVSASPYVFNTGRRDTLGTTVLDASPEHAITLSTPSWWPLVLAIGASIIFVGSIWTLWAVPAGLVVCSVAIVGWNWPPGRGAEREVR